MKLRIPRRIKVEDDSSDSETEPNMSNSTENCAILQSSMECENDKGKIFTTEKVSLGFVTSDTGYHGGLSVISGAPTRTTSTLTPTTLRNIEQTFQDLTNDLSQSAPYQAGFVPPPPAPTGTINQDQYTSYHQPQDMIPSFLTEEANNNSIESIDTSSMSDSSWHTPPPMTEDSKGGNNSSLGKGRPRTSYTSSIVTSQGNGKPRRNVGGRKPNKPSNISPEEEEKRRVRRERNKQAAARCRRRREDHTQELQKQVDEMEDKKRQLTAEIQQISKMRDELCELIEEHRKSNSCVKGDRESPTDIKPNVNGKNCNVPVIFTTTSMTIQRPEIFTASFSNNNNNNTLNANSKLSLKIKAEPIDLYDDEPPSKKRCDMVSGQEYDITTPTTPYMPQLNTPTFIPNKQSPLNKPNRPSSLNVPANRPSDALQRKNETNVAGINVCTPSTGMFNFESLMEGGTGLTPVSNPLVPCSTQNRNPLEMLHTPTSGNEPNKLVSL